MQGMFAIIRKNAPKLKIEKIPAMMYSWNAALTVNVDNKHRLLPTPARRKGK